MEKNESRRLFLKTLALSVGAIFTLPFANIQGAFAALVDAKDPVAKALGYVANGKDAKDRKDKTQNCGKCQFYGDATGKAAAAKCQLITSGDVQGAGWCRSFSARAPAAKKPAAKKS